MKVVSLNTAVALTGLSKRTLWRRIAANRLRTLPRDGKPTQVSLDDVLSCLSLSVTDEDQRVILSADQGDPQSQCEVGLLLLDREMPVEAVIWLTMSAEHFFPEGMYWLGRCLIAGAGTQVDVSAGMYWLQKSAKLGHVIAGTLLSQLNAHQEIPEDLDRELDNLERALILETLHHHDASGITG